MKSNLISKTETTTVLKQISDDWKIELPKIKNLKFHHLSDNEIIITGSGLTAIKINDKILPHLSEVKLLEKENDELVSSIADNNKLNIKLSTLKDIKSTLAEKHKGYSSMVGFFEQNEDCPTCEQHIDETFKINLPEQLEQNLALIFNSRNKYIGIAPGAGENNRIWPLEKFIEIGKYFEKKNYTFLKIILGKILVIPLAEQLAQVLPQ